MYEIIDDFLSQEDFLNITDTFFPEDLNNPNNFAWTYVKGIVRDPDLVPIEYEKHAWKYSLKLYSSNIKLKYNRHYSIVQPIIDQLKIKNLFSVRADLLVPTKEHIYHGLHTDRKTPHRVALFYVTTSNGFTVLKDTTEVQCVANRMLLFDGSIEHHSVTSTDSPRCVININYA